MSILKTKTFFTYVVVGALVMALSISCKSNEDPIKRTGYTTQNHPPQGNYALSFNTYENSDTKATVIVNDDGTCSITGIARYESEYQNFNITITKWYYFEDTPYTYYAGSSYEESEATINSPSGVDFDVSYDVLNSELSIGFGPEGKRYSASYLVRQQ